MQRQQQVQRRHTLLALVGMVSGSIPPIGLQAFILSEVRGIYDYHSQGPDELEVSEGARIQLTSGPSGGRNYAEGWWEGQPQRAPVSNHSVLI